MRVPTLLLPTLLLFLSFVSFVRAAEPERRPLLVSVDDLPIAAGTLHTDPAERARITKDLLAVLARHRVKAVGFVVWRNLRGDGERALLERWLDAGHELGNHTRSHLDYSRTDEQEYLEDARAGEESLRPLLAVRGKTLRFFRFPYLDEGDTPEKLRAMRDYLARSGQRNLPVTIDDQDWSFEKEWVDARRAGDAAAMKRIGERYQAALRVAVLHHERTGDALFGRRLPQVLLLHANEVGAAQWDALFRWLADTGHAFAGADEVLRDPVFAEEPDFVWAHGCGLWDRVRHEREVQQARVAVQEMLEDQARAWSRGDLGGFVAPYASDAEFLGSSGRTSGRERILTRYREKYPDAAAMGKLELEIVSARPLWATEISMLEDAAPGRVQAMSVTARWKLVREGKDPQQGFTLLVLRKTGAGWEIVSDASM